MDLDLLAVCGLLAVPAVVALHTLRRRFERRTVSAVFLFADVSNTHVEGPRRERLRRSGSFWLEVAAAALFSILLAANRTNDAVTHHVIVLDGSAAMQAEAGGSSAYARARRAIETLADGGRVTLIASGSPPTMLAGPAAPVAELAAALDRFVPWQPRHDLFPAIDLARGIARGGRVDVFTDRFDSAMAVPSEVAVSSVGVPVSNVGFVAASREAGDDDATDRVTVVLACFSAEDAAPQRRELRVELDGKKSPEIEDPIVTLRAGERRAMSFRIPRDAASIELHLEPDALTADDFVALAARPRRTLRVHSSLAPEMERELGLRSPRGESADRWVSLCAPAMLAATAQEADLCLAAAVPDSTAAWSIVLPLLGSATAVRRDLVGPFLIDRSDPLCDGLTLEGIVWSVDPSLAVAGAPLITAGNLPLLGVEDAGGRRIFRVDLDPRRSSVQRSPDWPILLVNVAAARRGEMPGLRRTDLALGESLEWRSRTPGSLSKVSLERDTAGPARRIELECHGVLECAAPAPPGLWTLHAADGESALFAVNLLDAGTSDLTAAKTARLDPTATVGASKVEASATSLTALLALLILVLMLADAWWLSRRVLHRTERTVSVQP